eukprot:g3053.t1
MGLEEEVSGISAYYAVLLVLFAGFLNQIGMHMLKTTFTISSRLGEPNFRVRITWIAGLAIIFLSFFVLLTAFTLGTLICTVPLIVGSTLWFSRFQTVRTNEVMRIGDFVIFVTLILGTIIVTLSTTQDDIVYSAKELSDLSKRAGTITAGSIGAGLIIAHLFWIRDVGKSQYDDYLVELIAKPGFGILPNATMDDLNDMPTYSDDMKRQALELEVEILLTKPNDAADITNMSSAKREIRSLRRALQNVATENSRVGESLLKYGLLNKEIHCCANVDLSSKFVFVVHCLIAALWSSLMVIFTKALGEVIETEISKEDGAGDFVWRATLLIVLIFVTIFPVVWSLNRGMHEHGNKFVAWYKVCFVISAVLTGLLFYNENEMFADVDNGSSVPAYIVGVTMICACMFLRTKEGTRLIYVEVPLFTSLSPILCRNGDAAPGDGKICCQWMPKSGRRVLRFMCPTIATIDAICYTDCDEIPSMNEAKLQWCRAMKSPSNDSDDAAGLEMMERGNIRKRSLSLDSAAAKYTDDGNSDADVDINASTESALMLRPVIVRASSSRSSAAGSGGGPTKTLDSDSSNELTVDHQRLSFDRGSAMSLSSLYTAKSQDSDDEEVVPMAERWLKLRRSRSATGCSVRSSTSDDGKSSPKPTSTPMKRRHFAEYLALYPMRTVLKPLRGGTDDEASCFSEPFDFMVRGENYLIDRKKIKCGKPRLHLIGADLHDAKPEQRAHIMAQSSHHVGRFMAKHGDQAPWLFVVNFMVPSGNISIYFASATRADTFRSSLASDDLLARFIQGSDNFRNTRLKLIPRIVKGNWFVRKVVGTKPAILGTKGLGIVYHRTKRYLEMDIDLTKSRVANGIWSVVQQYAESLVIDLAFVIESQHVSELPENLLGSVRFHHGRFAARVDDDDVAGAGGRSASETQSLSGR